MNLHQLAAATAPLLDVVTATDAGSRLVCAAPGPAAVDEDKRELQGLVVPFGRPGETSGGRLSFDAGRLAVSSAARVKLLREHDQHDPVGVGASFDEVDAAEADRRLVELGREPMGVGGVWGRFTVPEGPNGDRALTEARNGLRDGFSVGVQLDDATMLNLRRTKAGQATKAAGQLREVSLVSVPAFDDARVAAHADLVVSTWDASTINAGAAGTNREERTTMRMTAEQRRRFVELSAKSELTDAERAELTNLTTLAAAELAAGDQADQAGQAAASAGVTTGQPATASAGQAVGQPAPAVVPAVAGAALATASIGSEPSTYSFDGSGHSIVRDLVASRLDADHEAADRVRRFNAELAGGNVASVRQLMTAAATRDDVDGAGTDLPSYFGGNPNRPDLMRGLVDVGRPFISRLTTVPISNAQPFAIPAVGEFTGVGPHTEGTPHRPAGTLSLSGDVVQPTATSGAWEVSRELLDATNPALDRIASRAMLRDYRRQSEGKVIELLNVLAADPAAHRYSVDGVLDFRAALLDFTNDDEEGADIAAVSKGMLQLLGLDVDTTERPQLPFVSPSNAVGTLKPGATGFAIDGVDVFRAARLDAGVTGAEVAGSVGVLARSEGILWAESSVLQFRFDEVLGPGVVKLALWAYSGAAILDTEDVQIIDSGADPTP